MGDKIWVPVAPLLPSSVTLSKLRPLPPVCFSFQLRVIIVLNHHVVVMISAPNMFHTALALTEGSSNVDDEQLRVT